MCADVLFRRLRFAFARFSVAAPTYIFAGKGDNKLGKLLERVRADALAGKDTEVWCAMRFQLATPLDVAVDFAVTKGGEVVAQHVGAAPKGTIEDLIKRAL